MKILFGVDVGGTDIKLGAFDWKSQKLLGKWNIKTDLSDEGNQIIPDVAKEIQGYLRTNALKESDVYGIGMGIPGPVDKDGNVEVCVNLSWKNFNPAEEMRKFFPNAYIQAGNDANVAALGEFVQGAGRKYKTMMLITLGTGVGGGIILNGNIVLGSSGLAGEIGHIAVGPKDSGN